jgi:hypothetical protein
MVTLLVLIVVALTIAPAVAILFLERERWTRRIGLAVLCLAVSAAGTLGALVVPYVVRSLPGSVMAAIFAVGIAVAGAFPWAVYLTLRRRARAER